MQGAIVMAQIGSSTDMSGIHKELHGVENVKAVYFLGGPTDILAHVEAPDMDAAMAAVMKIRAVKGIASTDTRFILPVH